MIPVIAVLTLQKVPHTVLHDSLQENLVQTQDCGNCHKIFRFLVFDIILVEEFLSTKLLCAMLRVTCSSCKPKVPLHTLSSV